MGKRSVRYAVIDAFTSEPFKGNPAAVCLLESAEDEAAGDEWMQSVASEFNISETAFLSRAVVGSGDLTGGASSPRFNLRWFTPATEVVLCGHGTLAAAHFLWTVGLINDDVIEFVTKSGILTAKKVRSNLVATTDLSPSKAEGLYIELDFPAVPSVECIDAEIPLIPETLNGAAIVNVQQTTADQQLIVELSSAKEILNLHPNYEEIQKYAGGNMIATARAPAGSMFDFFTRYFAPKFGINEDPVCGSAHCILAPYWSKSSGKATSLLTWLLQEAGYCTFDL